MLHASYQHENDYEQKKWVERNYFKWNVTAWLNIHEVICKIHTFKYFNLILVDQFCFEKLLIIVAASGTNTMSFDCLDHLPNLLLQGKFKCYENDKVNILLSLICATKN